jgi:hypothetical protein
MDINQLLQEKLTSQLGVLVFQLQLKEAQMEVMSEELRLAKEEIVRLKHELEIVVAVPPKPVPPVRNPDIKAVGKESSDGVSR